MLAQESQWSWAKKTRPGCRRKTHRWRGLDNETDWDAQETDFDDYEGDLKHEQAVVTVDGTFDMGHDVEDETD